MPPHPYRPDSLAWQVFRGSDAIRRGLLTRHQLRSASWIRLLHDVYADARLDRDHGLTCRAALLRLPPDAAIAGPSAAYLHGIEHAASFTDEVHVLVPRTIRVDSQRGIRVHSVGPLPPTADVAGGRGAGDRSGDRDRPAVDNRPGIGNRPAAGDRPGVRTRPAAGDRPGVGDSAAGRLAATAGAAGQVGTHRGSEPVAHRPPVSVGMLQRSDPGAAAWETAVWLDPVRAVGIVDSLLARGLTTRAALADVATHNAERPGGRRASWVFGLADPGAQSPPESHLRVRLVLAGLPRPVVQHPVRLPNGLVLHPDLAWPECRAAVEYDGHWHADADQLHADRRRLNQLVSAGWLVLHVTSRRLHRDFPGVLREVRSALAARGRRR
ncbi:Transcriptional regulator, AbiEi antitoxin, Type IV TA system [Micromonospora echinaurantiaca]|uniref:Transcriptional regulator, AbiEi antitoxin, Type IV TA system n=1 Tax=Micromonospora echinaurantiaca TaxID=47857 RepID=A0A1C5K5N2_9ACTN|nr:hypothetical protein [Micromonospora echinaurantiaca]SCG77706.1 Transcriptional regulator, AbiEi antitoxin, Type IV TA system [Micromonospora echinaurantiaca]